MDVHNAGCGLGPDSTFASSSAQFIQLVIAILNIASLGIKFKLKPKGRTPSQLLKDGFKQIAGAVCLWAMNTFFSDQLLQLVRGEDVDACGWYFVQLMLDTTVGVWVAFMIFDHFMSQFRSWGMNDVVIELVQSEREDEACDSSLEENLVQAPSRLPSTSQLKSATSPSTYLKQIGFWLLVVILMKMAMVAIIYCLATPLQAVAVLIFGLIPEGSKALFVKIITPFFMNTFQYWLFDNIFLNEYDTVFKKVADEKKVAALNLNAKQLRDENERLVGENGLLKNKNTTLQETNRKLENTLEALKTNQSQEQAAIQKKAEDIAKQLKKVQDQQAQEHERRRQAQIEAQRKPPSIWNRFTNFIQQ